MGCSYSDTLRREAKSILNLLTEKRREKKKK
jgi:hypothetical protein